MIVHSYDYDKTLLLFQIKCQNFQEAVIMHSSAPSTEPATQHTFVDIMGDFLPVSFILPQNRWFPSVPFIFQETKAIDKIFFFCVI